ncbi:MAG: rhodanese domain-containing protein, partial [Candidatus Omnitrophota bacterium]|nr:rhodanese domain-containing protein [Candidatus Omnitrophota bacterium]
MHNVILYYNFVRISHPNDFCQSHKKYCQSLQIKGRVYIAHEGINGTLAGTVEAIDQYKQYLTSLPGFEGTEFKEELYSEIPFVKLTVKTRPEIVTLKADVDVDPTKEKGAYLEPKEWRKALES